ncbi:hypothetical protein QE424_002503 [Stenotrophomonas rhizophila]|uniref:AB hydrolase-1 domain-containing protein n=1 Tax=Stenotrophomonas rhizophila TaxID=216778 RepID=A0AAP5AIR2_9GAMM|nr:alpha/beta fold hydrolase [Stenotrophomonas rhizophila]MDQ1109344.1 hypothetical protein [Stenotrophomonas rhizophila]
MQTRTIPRTVVYGLAATLMVVAVLFWTATIRASEPLQIQSQGSFVAGGTVQQQPGAFDALHPAKPDGQSYHGDHVYAFYQVPVNARPLSIVMWHGAGPSSRSWETTADGREGFQNLFLRRRFTTYLIDQPRRGKAGRSMVESTLKPVADDQMWFNQFRIGLWPDYFAGSQFPKGEATLDQFFRSFTPNTGPYDLGVVSDSATALLQKTGPAILVTHSQAGGPGWMTAIKSPNVRAIVAFEPAAASCSPRTMRLHRSPARSTPLHPSWSRRRSSKPLPRSPSWCCTATTSLQSRSARPRGTAGVLAWKWRVPGATPSIGRAAMSP